MALSVIDWNRPDNIDCCHLAASNAAFPLHTHEEYAISANLSGVEEICLNRKKRPVFAGEVTLYNPGTLQSSQFGEQPVEFYSIHLPVHVFSDLTDRSPPILHEGVLHDPLLFNAICQFVRSFDDRQIQQENLLWLTSRLMEHGNAAELALPPAHVELAIEYMRDNLTQKPTLDELAAVCGLSKYHFVRQFRQEMGVAPLQFHMQLRLLAARNLLRHRSSALDVAHRLGFYDQSHFINSFRRMMGITPHHYQRILNR